ncbi:MAG: DnaJ domain-containing protein [Candidatus Aminicenantes bacterium]|nr:DnaJ domain-containing protein [Candidatus Aminicenantes bacterium]
MEHIAIFLRDIYFNKRQGVLIFQKKNINKFIFFRDGFLIFAKTNQPDELLGQVLYKLGKLSEETYREIEKHIEPRQNIGETLVNKGLIAQEDLLDGLHYQMREIVLNLFPFFEGEFKFQEKEDFGAIDFDIRIDSSLLIEDGIRRMKYDQNLKRFLEKRIPVQKSREFYFRLTEDEKNIYKHINGELSSDSILQSLEVHPDLFWKSLYLFYCLDLIGLEEEENVLKGKQKEKGSSTKGARFSVEDVIEFHSRLGQLDYYQILGVSRTAILGDVKKAYFRMARKYHPDLFPRDLPDEIKKKISDVFDKITKAYQVLSDGVKRKEYDTKVDTHEEEDKKGIGKTAEIKFRQAKTLFNQGRYEEASIFLEEAVRLDKNKGSYFLLLAMTQSKIRSLHRQAEENFQRAIELEPWNPETYAGLGLLYKSEGMPAKAKKQFRMALSIDPDHKIARKELGIQYGKKKKKGLQDILSFIFSSKKK